MYTLDGKRLLNSFDLEQGGQYVAVGVGVRGFVKANYGEAVKPSFYVPINRCGKIYRVFLMCFSVYIGFFSSYFYVMEGSKSLNVVNLFSSGKLVIVKYIQMIKYIIELIILSETQRERTYGMQKLWTSGGCKFS